MINKIIKIVSDYYSIPTSILLAKKRGKMEVSQARHICMYFSKKYTQYSEKQIGFIVGERDRTTVIHAIKTIEGLMRFDKKLRKEVNHIERIIVGNKIFFAEWEVCQWHGVF